jgi:hypothetical protein
MAPTASLLPPNARADASSSISSAYAVAPHLGSAAPRLIDSANQAFVTAMHWAAGIGAVVAIGGVAVVLAWLPRYSAAQPTPDAQPESPAPLTFRSTLIGEPSPRK